MSTTGSGTDPLASTTDPFTPTVEGEQEERNRQREVMALDRSDAVSTSDVDRLHSDIADMLSARDGLGFDATREATRNERPRLAEILTAIAEAAREQAYDQDFESSGLEIQVPNRGENWMLRLAAKDTAEIRFECGETMQFHVSKMRELCDRVEGDRDVLVRGSRAVPEGQRNHLSQMVLWWASGDELPNYSGIGTAGGEGGYAFSANGGEAGGIMAFLPSDEWDRILSELADHDNSQREEDKDRTAEVA